MVDVNGFGVVVVVVVVVDDVDEGIKRASRFRIK